VKRRQTLHFQLSRYYPPFSLLFLSWFFFRPFRVSINQSTFSDEAAAAAKSICRDTTAALDDDDDDDESLSLLARLPFKWKA
jgi:hypothetical protein